MTFAESLYLLLIDKVIIAGIAFGLWHFYSKQKKLEERAHERIRELENEKRQSTLNRMQRQLSEQVDVAEDLVEKFFWPLTLCMKKDDAVWKRVPSLSNAEDHLPTKTGRVVETDFLIPNHEKAVRIIEENFHLVADDEELIPFLVTYIRHVAVYRSLRVSGVDLNPVDVDEPFPRSLPKLLEARLERAKIDLSELKSKQFAMTDLAGE